ncbi:unnamed protein product, partial [Meganyctiphanes norvegica]
MEGLNYAQRLEKLKMYSVQRRHERGMVNQGAAQQDSTQTPMEESQIPSMISLKTWRLKDELTIWRNSKQVAFQGGLAPAEVEQKQQNLIINANPPFRRGASLKKEVEGYIAHRLKWLEWKSFMNLYMLSYKTVMQRWVSFIQPTLEPAKWNSESTQKLIDTINMLRSGSHIPWAQVHQHMLGFSRQQIQSRWRVINPEQSKGPFTVEEDFILIKGLHKFGLNFSLIAHFMPGRNLAQVRDRYKRTILPGLAQRPWTFAEDSIITRRCQVGPRNWKRMMIDLPRHESCEIRCRYHIIQVWQTITDGSNMRPPPLFPISMTVDKEEVREIRKSLIQEKSDAKTLVDKSRNEADVKSAVKELEDRRRLIKNRKVATSVKRLEKAVEKRGRKPGTSIPHKPSVPDIMLTDFFLPGRDMYKVSWQNHQSEENALAMAESLQLKLTEAISNEEWEVSRELNVTDEDRAIIDYIMQQVPPSDKKHKLGDIPLIPANHTNTGGLHSLLLHRPKIEEMATGNFLFYRLKKEEYKNLGRDPNSIKKMLKQTVKAAGMNDDISANGASNSSPSKIPTTTAGGLHGRKRGTWKNRITYAKNAGNDASSSDVTMSDSSISLDVENTDESGESQEKSEEDQAFQRHSDELLFQRFLSIFYYPALMTLITPSVHKIEEANLRLAEMVNPPPLKRPRLASAVKLAPKDVLDIESQVKYIDQLMEEAQKYDQLKEEFKGNRERGNIQTEMGIEPSGKKVIVKMPEENQMEREATENMEIQQDETESLTVYVLLLEIPKRP